MTAMSSSNSHKPASIGPHDVLCGRGGATNNHPGNQRFRAIVAEHMPEYLLARKKEKAHIARRVVRSIQRDGGRFLKRQKDHSTGTEVWMEVTDKKATEKTSQALREGLDVRHKTYRPEKLSAGTRLNARIPQHHNSPSQQYQRQQQLQRSAFLPVSPSSPYSENPRTRTRLVEGTVLSPHHAPSMAMTTVSTLGAQRLLHRIPRDPSQDDLPSSCGSSVPDLAPEAFLPAAFRPPRHPLQALFEPPRITRSDCEDVAAV